MFGTRSSKRFDSISYGSGITPTELARSLVVPPNRIVQILHGKRCITADTAIRLGLYFRMEPEFWMRLQNAYDLRLAAGKAVNLPQQFRAERK